MKNLHFAALAAAVALTACSENGKFLWLDRPDNDDVSVLSHDMIVLGEQLPDPYSVGNMTKAYEALYSAAAGRSPIQATDFYVRFLPKDEAQMQLLLDMGLQLLDHPLDYRIVREGDWYHDPSIPDNAFTWQYAVVPVDFEFPLGVRFERLEDCYLSEHDPATKGDGIDWTEVEREAFRITGNEDLLLPCTRGEEGPFFPEGTITIMDTEHSSLPIGVKGVRVCCNSFVKIATAYTDENGHYKMSRSYSSDLRYRLMFKNMKGFSQGINNILLAASVSALGTYPASGCSVTISDGSDYSQFTRCVVNNAGYDYYKACEKSSGALPQPPKDLRIWSLPLLSGSFNVMMHHGVLLETFEPLHAVLGELAIVARMAQPDAYLGLEGCSSYNDAYERALLVFAQAGHFSRVTKDWWYEYVLSAIGSAAFETFAQLLGEVTEGIDAGAHAEVVNAWSNYCRTVLYRRNYPDSQAVFEGGRSGGTQILLYLDERGLGLESLAQLLSPDLTDMDMLKQKLLSFFPQNKTIILEAFARYGI